MGKEKYNNKKGAAAVKPVAVKEGRVTKPADTPKAKSKDTAKKVAKVTEKEGKKSKKSKKEPTPEPSSSESDSDEEMDSDSSDSSESEAEAKPAAKTNGAAKKAAKEESTSDSDSDDSSESEDEKPAAKAAVVAKSDSSDSDSDSESEDEKPAAKAEATKASSDDDSSDDSSDEESAEEKPAKVEEPSKKRKAETESAGPAKKVKHEGEFSVPSNVLFVGGLSWNVDEDWLSREFEECSPVSVRVITHADSGRSKGFAYVEFADTNAAIEALNTKHGVELDGRALRCDFSSPRQPKPQDGNRVNNRAEQYGDKKSTPSATLFCGNLSFDTTQDSLTGYFSEFGTINGIRLPTDRDTGAPKGYGYVEFSSVEEAQSALDGLNGADVDGRNIRLDFSTPRDNSNAGGRGGGFNGGRGGGFNGGRGGGGRGGGRGGRGGFGDRGGRGGARGGSRGGFSTNRGGFGDFSGKKVSFD